MDGIDKTTTSFESLGLTKREPLQQKRLSQEDFMQLMMAQMKHQDPFKPMANGEFIGQMAQFSSVKGLKEIKDSFNTLSSALQSAQALQASSIVGRGVLVPGTVTELSAQGQMKGAVKVPHNTENVVVNIADKKGQLIKTIDLGAKQEGVAQFSWDGVISEADPNIPGSQRQVAEPGQYTISAQIQVDGELQAIDTLVVDQVNSVSLGKDSQGIQLNLSNSGSTSLANVEEIL